MGPEGPSRARPFDLLGRGARADLPGAEDAPPRRLRRDEETALDEGPGAARVPHHAVGPPRAPRVARGATPPPASEGRRARAPRVPRARASRGARRAPRRLSLPPRRRSEARGPRLFRRAPPPPRAPRDRAHVGRRGDRRAKRNRWERRRGGPHANLTALLGRQIREARDELPPSRPVEVDRDLLRVARSLDRQHDARAVLGMAPARAAPEAGGGRRGRPALHRGGLPRGPHGAPPRRPSEDGLLRFVLVVGEEGRSPAGPALAAPAKTAPPARPESPPPGGRKP